MTRIKYKEYGGLKNKKIDQDLGIWLDYNLSSGGIEEKIEKCTNLLVIMAEHFLSEKPDKLEDVVRAIQCSGSQHKLSRDDTLGPIYGTGPR